MSLKCPLMQACLSTMQGNFPMPIRVTSVLNETLDDVIHSLDGNNGTVQFSALPGPAYVSGMLPGHGLPELNTPRFVLPPNATANIGPIKCGPAISDMALTAEVGGQTYMLYHDLAESVDLPALAAIRLVDVEQQSLRWNADHGMIFSR